MQSIQGRNEAAHTYDEEIARKLCHDILEKYLGAFMELRTALQPEAHRRNLIVHVWIGYGYSSRYKGLSHQSA